MIPVLTRKTTPTHSFTFPANVKVEDCEAMEIIYAQAGEIKIRKHMADLTFDGQTANLVLSQAETALFKACIPVDIEFWVRLADGTVPAPFRTAEHVADVMGGDFNET